MSTQRRRIFTVLISIIILLTMLAVYYVLAVCNFKSYTSLLKVDEENNTLTFDTESIRILQLSDIQTSNLVESAIAYPMVERLVKRTKPDLIVLTGDNISNNSSAAVLNTFIRFMDSFEIPWALVFGNHDIQSTVSPTDQCAAYENSKYCLFKRGNIEERYGNYFYKIKSDEKTIYSLIFMDSASSSFTKEQVEWYRNTVTDVSQENGSTVPSLAFFHIPIAETADAHSAYEKDCTIGSGKQVDRVRTQDKSTGFFSVLQELGSTKALFFGHDHKNNTFIDYKGVKFCYATKTGKTVYYERDSLGGNLITIYKDSSFTVERVHE